MTEGTAMALVGGAICTSALLVWWLAVRGVIGVLREQQQMLTAQVEVLQEEMEMLRGQLAARAAGERAKPPAEALEAADEIRGENIGAEIAPEIQAAIAAAAIAAAGPAARVRWVRGLKPRADGSAWSQQGRVLVQTSHNVRAAR